MGAEGNVSGPHPLQERWSGLPPNIEAAAVSLENGDFYFFKGTPPGADENVETYRGKRSRPRSKEGRHLNSNPNLWPGEPYQEIPLAVDWGGGVQVVLEGEGGRIPEKTLEQACQTPRPASLTCVL